MGYAKWAFLRTIGGLAANTAQYQTKLRQLSEEVTLHSPAQIDAEVQAMLPAARLQFAESVYGPSDPVWENKIRTGLSRAYDELSFLEGRQAWTEANCCRFLELYQFLESCREDQSVMNDVMRFDMKDGTGWGMAKMLECFNIIKPQVDGRRAKEIAAYGPKVGMWLNEIYADPELTKYLAEARFGVSGKTDKCVRAFAELTLPPEFNGEQESVKVGTCSDCGGKVSKKIKVCPHCGNPEVF